MDSSAHHYYWAFAKNVQTCSRRLSLKRRAIFDNVRIQRLLRGLWGALGLWGFGWTLCLLFLGAWQDSGRVRSRRYS